MLHVVTGPPCAGKTTYIAEHKERGDVVVDFDALAVALGADSSHMSSGAIASAAFTARRAVIGAIGDATAWVIHTNPSVEQREGYAGAVFHDLDPGKAECIRRARADGRPDGTIEAIERYYREHDGSQPSVHSPAESGADSPTGAQSPFFYARKGQKGVCMEEQAQEQAEAKAPEEQTDWQAKYEAMRQHSRDWEKRARENEGAAKELEELKASQLSEQEKANARAEKAERELESMKAQAKRASDAREVAEGKGVPLWMLENLPDRDAMEAFADRYLKESEPEQVHAAAKSAKSRVNKGEGKPPTTAQMFADAIEGF